MGANNAGTILVVEDNPDMRDISVQMFELGGFDVLEAADARSGLDLFQQNQNIDLVFTDVIMPGGISGIEMAKEMLALDPNTLILIATGYTAKAEALVNSAANSENIAVVTKPYDIKMVPKLAATMIRKAEE